MNAPEAIGIDLGTTRSVVAWTSSDRKDPELFAIRQLSGPRELDYLPGLPSFLYAAQASELSEHPLARGPWIVGEYAQRRAAETSHRAAFSAKSWLAHRAADPTLPILPWPANDEAPIRISPVDATRTILEHIKFCWNERFPNHPLESSTVILTVPASFDPMARQLTLEAAERAGLLVRLLEEPIAAFHAWFARTPADELTAQLSGREQAHVLVCDVGGGTTDFSLIRLVWEGGAVAAHRVSVGRHLLLGGDNFDLALALRSEAQLTSGEQRLPAALFAQLVQQCRQAKEALLASNAPEKFPLVLVERGSELLGKTRRGELERKDVESVLRDGFLPRVPLASVAKKRAGLVGFGLPYESDPAITRHLAEFLATNAAGRAPDLILINGGLFNSEVARAQLMACLRDWYDDPPRPLFGTDVNTAVAQGAASFGLAVLGHGARVSSATTEAYFVGVDGQARREAVCVIPRGSQQGERHAVGSRVFALRLGQPVRFELFAARNRSFTPGGILATSDAELVPLGFMVSELYDDEGTGEAAVQLEGELTSTGVIDLGCVPVDGNRLKRRRLSFELGRAQKPAPAQRKTTPPALLSACEELVDRVYGQPRKDFRERESRDLLKNLERQLGLRASWSLEVSRRMGDMLLDRAKGRQRSRDHERLFFLLVGYCLRPGTGAPLDEARALRFGRLLIEGLRFQDEARGWQQYFIALRRVAAGLGAREQGALRKRFDPFLAPAARQLKKAKGLKVLALAELMEAASYLERAPVAARLELGDWLIERTWSDRDPKLWEAVARLGSRVPLYASVQFVLPPEIAERWLGQLLQEKWAELPGAKAAAVRLARRTDDRARDITDSLRGDVVRALERAGASLEELQRVTEHVPVAEAERQLWYGDDLPAGLRLMGGSTEPGLR